jgi:hypothetical protein
MALAVFGWGFSWTHGDQLFPAIFAAQGLVAAIAAQRWREGRRDAHKTHLTQRSPYARLNRLGKLGYPLLSETRCTPSLEAFRGLLRGVFRRAGVVKQAACDPYAKGVRLGRSETSSLGLFRPGIKCLDRSWVATGPDLTHAPFGFGRCTCPTPISARLAYAKFCGHKKRLSAAAQRLRSRSLSLPGSYGKRSDLCRCARPQMPKEARRQCNQRRCKLWSTAHRTTRR